MARDISSSCKRCRRAGEKLFLKGDRCLTPKCAVVRKPYPPGIHGKGRKGGGSRGVSEYGKQLAMKQKIKRVYGVMERQFRKHFSDSQRVGGVTGDLLLQRLELRLDNVIYRIGFASSRTQARQQVLHGSFLVNGRKVDRPARALRTGDTVTLAERKRAKSFYVQQATLLKNKKDIPGWIQFDAERLSGTIVALPTRDQLDINTDPQMVVEYYSR